VPSTHSVCIVAVELADDPVAWRQAGFSVDDNGSCFIGSLRIDLRGRTAAGRQGLLSWSFGGLDAGGAKSVHVLDGVETHVVADDASASASTSSSSSSNANTCVSLGELTLFVRDLAGTCRRLAETCQVHPHKRRAPRALPGPMAGYEVAAFFFGGTRVLIVGPSAERAAAVAGGAAAGGDSGGGKNPMAWMLGGSGPGAAETELTGWLPEVTDMGALRRCLERGGLEKGAKERPAVQVRDPGHRPCGEPLLRCAAHTAL
jgi:hypothetical protein